MLCCSYASTICPAMAVCLCLGTFKPLCPRCLGWCLVFFLEVCLSLFLLPMVLTPVNAKGLDSISISLHVSPRPWASHLLWKYSLSSLVLLGNVRGALPPA